MYKFLLPILVIVTFQCSLSGLVRPSTAACEAKGISYVWEGEPNYEEAKQAFVQALVQALVPCYFQTDLLDDVDCRSKEAIRVRICEAFDEMYEDFSLSEEQLWISAKSDGIVVGFLILKTDHYPESLYIAQLAVDPNFQGRGIAKTLVKSVISEFDQCKQFDLMTRHSFEVAKHLYTSLGFIPSSYIHEGYDPKLYVGFKYVNIPN